MPRQGVPYPSREICSLKCQIDALQRQINELMKSVNGVEGDGQGNVSLISGDPAIVINNDQAQHEIEISLDTSQLPAADVSSVNGQTGVVDLDGSDIPLNPGQSTPTVQNAVAANAGNISQLQADLNQEILDRGNADSALQSNINAVSAGIPAAAAAAVAADPTVAQLAVDVPNKLDKITSGSALKAYTHTGATQGEKSVVDGTTADSIAIRDANGRLRAADPASGATDKTLTTANWVSQTGDSAPNNLLHRSGNENFKGIKQGRAHLGDRDLAIPTPSVNGQWHLMLSCIFASTTDTITIRGTLQDSSNAMSIELDDFIAIIASNTSPYNAGKLQSRINTTAPVAQKIAFAFDGTHLDIWVNVIQYRPMQIIIDNISRYGVLMEPEIVSGGNTFYPNYTTYRTYTHNLEVTRT